MVLKTKIRDLLFLLVYLFVGFQDLNSQGDECPTINICIEEIRKIEEDLPYYEQVVHSHFSEKEGAAYDAWRVLYEAAPNVNRMNVSILEEIEDYFSASGRQVDDVIQEIKAFSLGYEGWSIQKLNPPKSTSRYSIDELLENVDYSANKKKYLELDLKASDALAKALGADEEMLEAWSLFYEIKVSDAMRNEVGSISAMASYVRKIKQDNLSFTLESFNQFVKDKLDKSAYVKSILYPIQSYGGIKISNELLSKVPLVIAKESSSQLSGTGKFGAYEVRLQDGQIQNFAIDSNGDSYWEAFNKLSEDINFVITNDGRLKLGHGHYNLSGQARTVFSAGKLVIKNGEITHIYNYSGHYQPSIDNLNKVAEVFEKLGVVSNDFIVVERAFSKFTE